MVKQKQKLAVFLPSLHGGGAERTMLNLAHGVANRGLDVDLVLGKAHGPYLTDVPDEVRLVDLKASRSLTSLGPLVRYLRRERPQAMVSALSRANIIALCARRLTGVPNRLVVNEQNTLSQWARNNERFLGRLTPRIAKQVYRWADLVVGVSQGVADDLVSMLDLPPDQVRVIFNPGITPELREKAQLPVSHPWLDPGQPPVLLSVGSLTPQKDYGMLLEAVHVVHKSRPVRLIVLGEGPERPALEAQVDQLGLQDDVSFPGFVSNPYAFMSRAAAFVLSSRWEGLPTVLVEALYCGPALIATDCPSGPREILKGGEFGSLVPVGQPAALAQAITLALDGQGPRPPENCWKPYTVEAVVDRYFQVLFPDSNNPKSLDDTMAR